MDAIIYTEEEVKKLIKLLWDDCEYSIDPYIPPTRQEFEEWFNNNKKK